MIKLLGMFPPFQKTPMHNRICSNYGDFSGHNSIQKFLAKQHMHNWSYAINVGKGKSNLF